MRPVPARLQRLPEQAFTSMLAAAAAAQAIPSPPAARFIDLGRGNPDLPPPDHAVEALRATAYHGYPPFQGEPALREAIAQRYLDDHGVTLDPDTEVAVVPGTKTAIVLACLALAETGGTVVLPDPGYPDYRSGVALSGAHEHALPLVGADHQPDWDALPAGWSLLVLNYPSNPTAACVAPGTFERALEQAERVDGVVLHDLAYGFLAFDGRARSLLEVGPRERALELWSPSKVFGMAGWRIGFVVGGAELVSRIKLLVDHVTAGVFLGLQRGLHAALTGGRDDEHARAATYRARRDRLTAALDLDPAPAGTFFAWWPLPDGLTAERIAADARVGVAPGPAFGTRGAGHARLSLAVPDADLDEAIARLAGLQAS